MNPLDPKLQLDNRRPPEEAESLAELASSANAGKWDAFMFTDGSGSTIDRPGGYAAVIVERRKSGVATVCGSVSNSTSQQSEVRALYEGMYYLIRKNKGNRKGGFRVQLITDSAYVAKTMQAIGKDPVELFSTKQHAMLWAGIQYVSRRGILVRALHIKRNQNPLMTLADTLSKHARKSIQGVDRESLVEQAVLQCESEFKL